MSLADRELADVLAANFDTTPARRRRRAEQAGADWAARRLGQASDTTPSPGPHPRRRGER